MNVSSQMQTVPEHIASTHQFNNARSWLVLVLLCAAQFLVVLDFSIVNVALPAIQQELHFSRQNLQWVVSAYALTLGGFLLLGGRIGDLFGRRRFFMLGLAIFVLASLLGGLSSSQPVLLLARALQGLGAALVSPNAFSLLTTIFEEGPARNKALGVFGAVVSSGLAIGNIAGGALTAGLGWNWVFFVNIPFAAVALFGAFFLLKEYTDPAQRQRLDVFGAIVVTTGLISFVYAIAQGNEVGWTSYPILGLLAFALLCIGVFVFIEMRVQNPLVRLGIFRLRSLTGANLVSLLAVGTFASTIFILTLYMQEVLGYTPFITGLAFLPLALMMALTSSLSARLVPRFAPRNILMAGMGLLATGLLLLLTITPENTYVNTILPGMLLICLGMGPAFTMMSILATSGVNPEEQGLAAGLLNTTQQIGNGIVLAIMLATATAWTSALKLQDSPSPVALVGGFHAALIAGIVAAALAFLIALLVPTHRKP